MKNPSAPAIDDLLTHGAWLRRLASNLVAADGEAEDLVQETWLAALVRGPERREEARAWLSRVMRNKAANRLRAARARTHRETDVASSESLPSTAVLAGRADMSRRLVELVLELPSDPQRILLARYFEGLSSAEIARRLDRPHATVRTQLKRGLDQLRSKLDAENEGERGKWLSALSPLITAPAGESLSAGAVLAASFGLKAALCAGLMIFAALAWWMSGGPGGSTSPPPLIVEERSTEASSTVPIASANLSLPKAEERSTETQPRGGRVDAVETPAVVASFIEGQVVHPESKEPVIWFELGIVPTELASPFSTDAVSGAELPEVEEMELVRTDEQGRFVSQREYPSGSYAIVPVEDWRVATPRMPQFRMRQPRAPLTVDHDAAEVTTHSYELETGPVFVIDCPKAVELGLESMVCVYAYLDHFPPGYMRPSPLQGNPVPFVRMHTDYAPSHRKKINNMRLVSTDGFWSGSIPMEITDSIATKHVSFDLEARALVEVDLDFGERHAPPVIVLQFWKGAVDPTADDAPEPDVVELQAKFDGTNLEEAIVMYMPTGTATIGVKSRTMAFWYRVVELTEGRNLFQATIDPLEGATGRIEGRLVHVEPTDPKTPIRVALAGEHEGEPLWHNIELQFEEQNGQWVADFSFTHLVPTSYSVFFDKGGPQTLDPTTFAVEPRSMQVDVDGPPLEFELHTDITKTRLRVKMRDQTTGKKIDDFVVSVFVPGVWLNDRRKESKSGRATMNLLGSLEGGLALIVSEGYLIRTVPLSEAQITAKGLEIEMEMTPGWGGPVMIQHTETNEPLAGASVLVDGVEVGQTDEEGNFELYVPKAPKRLDFELAGYDLVSQYGRIDTEGEVLPYDGDPTGQYFQAFMRKR